MQYIPLNNEIRSARILRRLEKDYNVACSSINQDPNESYLLRWQSQQIGLLLATKHQIEQCWVHPDFRNQKLSTCMIQYFEAEKLERDTNEKLAAWALQMNLEKMND